MWKQLVGRQSSSTKYDSIVRHTKIVERMKSTQIK